MFSNSSNFHVSGGQFIVESNHGRSGVDRLFDYTIPGAAHDSYVAESKASCLEGTRLQYIEDITSWTTGLNQPQQHYLLWMYGFAGVGKSAVAKSCAEKTAEHGALGATFFFSRHNGVNDPSRFFTTIAYQLAAKTPEYRRILGARVDLDSTVLSKRLEVQFHELIIAPFLELDSRRISVPQRAVFVDGLDECDSNVAQSEIVDLVAQSTLRYGKRVPLLWAFFSRPEHHIANAFSKYSNSSLLFKVELPVSRDYDADIRLYLRNSLHLPISASNITRRMVTLWPSDKDLDMLVRMVAGLFIYAATIVKFIMDPGALGPQRQLKVVLSLASKLRTTPMRSNSLSAVTVELDAFYSMIMGRISPDLLPVTQQILLIHHETNGEPIRLPANILGLTLPELENSLSNLRSVLTLKASKDDLWPGSARIIIYHASFMEFLLDKERSKEYWIQDQSHYHTLAIRGLRLFDDMYLMNGIPRNGKLRRLRHRLPVFPDSETFTSTECLKFRDELIYSHLTRYTLGWCARSGLGVEVVEELRKADLANLRRPQMRVCDDDRELFPVDIRSYVGQYSYRRWECLRSPTPELPEVAYPDPTAPIQEFWAYIFPVPFDQSLQQSWDSDIYVSLLWQASRNPYRCAYVSSRISQHFSSHIRTVLQTAKKLELESLDDYELLDYYSYEWSVYPYTRGFNCLQCSTPSVFRQAAMLPWKDFLTLMQGSSQRLTRAAHSILKQARAGDLLGNWPIPLIFPRDDPLDAFGESLSQLSSSSPGPTWLEEQILPEVLRDAETYYTAASGDCLTSASQLGLEHVLERLTEEARNYSFLIHDMNCYNSLMHVCTKVLMMDLWEDLYAEFKKLLDSNDEDGNKRFQFSLWRIAKWNPTAISQFRQIFEAHVRKNILAALTNINCTYAPSPENVKARAKALHGVKWEERDKAETLFRTHEDKENELCECVDYVFDDILWEDSDLFYMVNKIERGGGYLPSGSDTGDLDQLYTYCLDEDAPLDANLESP